MEIARQRHQDMIREAEKRELVQLATAKSEPGKRSGFVARLRTIVPLRTAKASA
jgi:hypothetical protein